MWLMRVGHDIRLHTSKPDIRLLVILNPYKIQASSQSLHIIYPSLHPTSLLSAPRLKFYIVKGKLALA